MQIHLYHAYYSMLYVYLSDYIYMTRTCNWHSCAHDLYTICFFRIPHSVMLFLSANCELSESQPNLQPHHSARACTIFPSIAMTWRLESSKSSKSSKETCQKKKKHAHKCSERRCFYMFLLNIIWHHCLSYSHILTVLMSRQVSFMFHWSPRGLGRHVAKAVLAP